jgi:hypothetical protein
MRRVIHKQVIPIVQEFKLQLPQNAKILSVQEQRDRRVEPHFVEGGLLHGDDTPQVCIWYSFHPNDYQNLHWHNFLIAATGHEYNVANDDMYVGTFQLFDGNFIGHLFHCGAIEAVFKGDVPAT